MDIVDIIEAIRANRVRITDHADEQAEADKLTFDEIYSSVLHVFTVKSLRITRPINPIRAV
jgi:hypothetical protein